MSQSKVLFKAWLPYILYLLSSLLLWWFIPSMSTRIENDSHAYLYFVKVFQNTGSFYPSEMTQLHTWFGIGYPAFMLFCLSIFNDLKMVIIVQIVLGLITIFFIQKSAEYVTNIEGAFYAALCAASNIGFVMYPHFFLTEALMLFFLSGILFLLTRESLALFLQLFLVGFLASLTFLIKPSLMYIVPFWGLYLIGQRMKERNWYQNIGCFFFFLQIVALVPIGMVFYYKKRFGYYYFKSVDKVNLYSFYLPHLIAAQKKGSFIEIQKELHQKYPVANYADPDSWNQIDLLLKKEIKARPFLAIKVWLFECGKTLCGLYTNHLKLLLNPTIKGGDCSFFTLPGSIYERILGYLFYGNSSFWLVGLACFEIIMRMFFFIFGLIAFCSVLYKREAALFWLLILPSAYFLLITGADGSGRLKLLIEPFWILLFVVGIKNIQNYYKRP